MADPLCETFIPDGFPSFSGVVGGSPIARTTVSNEFPSFGGAADGSRIVRIVLYQWVPVIRRGGYLQSQYVLRSDAD